MKLNNFIDVVENFTSFYFYINGKLVEHLGNLEEYKIVKIRVRENKMLVDIEEEVK